MLTECNITAHDRRLDFRKVGCTEIFLPKQPINRPSTDSSKKRPPRINPGVIDIRRLLLDRTTAGLEAWIAGLHEFNRAVRIQIRTVTCAEKYRTRRNERDQLMRVDGQRVPASRILQIIPCHPVILVGRGDVLDSFSILSAMEFRAALTR